MSNDSSPQNAIVIAPSSTVMPSVPLVSYVPPPTLQSAVTLIVPSVLNVMLKFAWSPGGTPYWNAGTVSVPPVRYQVVPVRPEPLPAPVHAASNVPTTTASANAMAFFIKFLPGGDATAIRAVALEIVTGTRPAGHRIRSTRLGWRHPPERCGSGPEDLEHLGQTIGKRVDVGLRRVDVEARPGRCRQVEPLVERHRAVVAGSHRNPEPVEDLGDVVRVDSRQVERDYAAPQIGVERTVELDLRDAPRQDLERVGNEAPLVLPDGIHAELLEVLRGHTQPDRVGDRRRARLELPGNVVPLAPSKVDLADHLAAGEERRHRFEQLAPGPQRAGAHRGQHLVAAERVEVGAEILDVDRHVGHGLGTVDQDEGAGVVGRLDHLLDRVDRAQRVRDVGERDELRLQPEQNLEDVESEAAVVGDRDELEVAVLLLDEELPRDEVRVVLHLGQDDRVAAGDVASAQRVGDEVDRLGRVPGEHDFVGIGRVDEPGDLRPGLLVLGGRFLADRVDPAVDVRVVFAVVVVDGVDDGLRLLRRRGRVEVDEAVAVDLLVEDREVAPEQFRVERRRGDRLEGDRDPVDDAVGVVQCHRSVPAALLPLEPGLDDVIRGLANLEDLDALTQRVRPIRVAHRLATAERPDRLVRELEYGILGERVDHRVVVAGRGGRVHPRDVGPEELLAAGGLDRHRSIAISELQPARARP